jgi:hypothetical protein
MTIREQCENELQIGLNRLLINMNSYGFDRRRKSWICCRQYNRNRHDDRDSTQHEILVDSSHPSLLYKILEAKLFNCLGANQRSFSNPVIKDETTSSDSFIELSSPHPITTNGTGSSINPSEISESNLGTSDVNDYEKATL